MSDKKSFDLSKMTANNIPFKFDFHKPTEEEIERRKRERAEDLEKKGFLPENEDYEETTSSPQEEVEKCPTKYIIKECIPACQELWSKNIYTFMVSDHLNEGVCWIEVVADSLSEENRDIYFGLSTDDVIKFSYHKGTINFGVRFVGSEGQQRLLEIAQKFKMQDVPKDYAYISLQDFLMRYCDCYEEYPNPNYKPMIDPCEANIVGYDKLADYMLEYEEWQDSEESQPKLRRFAPEKVSGSIAEQVIKHGMVLEDDRVYLSLFHYNKHLNYVKSVSKQGISDTIQK